MFLPRHNVFILCICACSEESLHHVGQRYSQSCQCSFSSEVSENFYITKSIGERHRGSHPGYDQEEGRAVRSSVRPAPVVFLLSTPYTLFSWLHNIPQILKKSCFCF